MSDVIVYRFAEKAWCAAAASPISATAIQGRSTLTSVANATGITQMAQSSSVILRAAFVDQPRPKSQELIPPPATDPNVARTYTVTIGAPIVLRSIPNRSF